MTRLFLLLIMFFTSITGAFAQRLAVNTNLLTDALLAPSAGVELTMTKKSTLSLNATYGTNVVYGKDNRLAAFQPEWRAYISGRPMYHHYVGIIGLLSSYKLSFDSKWHDGDAAGIGVSFGYVLPLSERFQIDFHSSLGTVYYHQKEYAKGEDYDATHLNAEGYPEANATGIMLMPLRIGIALSYIIK